MSSHHMKNASAGDNWSSGYVSDVAYTLGFHHELAPSFLHAICLACGVEGLPASRRLRYCELGSGRGYGTALLAASNPDIDFVGIDFNRSHVSEARGFADRAGLANVKFFEMTFGDAARSADPELDAFDIVVLHGVYAWVPPQVRDDIHDFLRAKLVSRGIAYVSYNAMPGWLRVVPTQRMLIEVANRSSGDSIARVEKGMQLLNLLVAKSDGMIARHGAVSSKYLSQLATKNRHYLAHEFLSIGWQPLFVTEAIAAMAKAELSYIGSAAVTENRIELCVPKDLRETVRSAPDVGMRELLKDYILGTQFRRDVYIKRPRQLDQRERRDRMMNLRFAPMPHVKSAPERLRTPMGQVKPKKEVLDAIWRRIDGNVLSGADLIDAATKAGEKEERVWPLIDILVNNAAIHPTRHDPGTIDGLPSRRVNTAIMEISRSANTHAYMASPVLGSAIRTNLPERIIARLIADEPGLDDITIAKQAFDCVTESGQDFMRDGRPVERTDKNVQALAGFVREVREHRLPCWRLLGVVD
jgi:Predicted methyltransferase regulatory domain/Methyltransferase domain